MSDSPVHGEEEFRARRPEGEEEPRTLRPLFDFKKVFKRLQGDIVHSDPTTAKRLLLRLHECFYHCPITDFKNMLLRAGLSSDVLSLAEEAVMSCAICRRYVRLPSRPQVKICANAGSFNDRVQMDLFQFKQTWVLLMVDEATRYKIASVVRNREHMELLGRMHEHWFTMFGPPKQIILDQETSLMGHEAGREMERFNIDRVPKGTTSGTAGKQHTGTGLVERHIGLMELSMKKLETELDRQGIRLEIHDLARECAFAQNQSLNYNGYTPSMAVFGVLPRPFFQEDSEGITATAGALQTDLTPFEKALRIRQIALSMVQMAVAEDRVARANRTRTQQLNLDQFIPGTTSIDFYREVQSDVGWRGPAELLKIDRDEGSAVISYQGRPYLVSLRHIRSHRAGIFLNYDETQLHQLRRLQALVDNMSPFKACMIGWVHELKDGTGVWRRASSASLNHDELWGIVCSVGRAHSDLNLGGAISGVSLRTVCPPKNCLGTLDLVEDSLRTDQLLRARRRQSSAPQEGYLGQLRKYLQHLHLLLPGASRRRRSEEPK